MSEYKPAEYWDVRYENFDITSSGHKDLPLTYNAWLYKMKMKKISAAACSDIDDFTKIKVMEMGCGTGVYVDLWKKHGVCDLKGLDIANNAVEELKKKFPEFTFHKEDLSDKTLVDRHGKEKYALVTAIGVLVHIVDDKLFSDAVQNISDFVSKDGIVLVSDYVVRGDTAEERTHMKLRVADQFHREFEEAGLELVRQVPFHFFMIAPFDTPSFLAGLMLPRIYTILNKMIHRFPRHTGGFLYIVDLLATRLPGQGPSEKLFVYRKK
jgi:phospholipid N-methyltransferase